VLLAVSMISQCRLLAQRYISTPCFGTAYKYLYIASYFVFIYESYILFVMEQESEQRAMLSSEDIKQALYRSAGYGGRCL